MKTISLKKKVAAVAVASLGLGLLSVVPANAAITATPQINLSAGTASVAVDGLASATFNLSTPNDAAANTNRFTYSIAVTTKPDDSSLAVEGASDTATNTTATAKARLTYQSATAITNMTLAAATNDITDTAGNAVAAANIGGVTRGSLLVKPDKPGIYVITLTAVFDADGAGAGAALAGTTTTFTVYAGNFIDTDTSVVTSKNLACTVGATITGSSCAGVAGGRVGVLVTNLAANKTYYLTTSGGAIVQADEKDDVVGEATDIASSFTNGVNFADGITISTDANGGVTVADGIQVLLQKADAGSATIRLETFNASTGIREVVAVGTVTFGSAAALDIASVTVYGVSNATCAGTETASTITYASKTASSGLGLCVIAKNGAGTEIGGTLTIAGNGIGLVGGAAVAADANYDGSHHYAVTGNGLSGTAKFTVTVTDANAKVATGSLEIRFFDSVSSIVITQTKWGLKDGDANDNNPIATFSAKDKNGFPVAFGTAGAGDLVVDSDVASTQTIAKAGDNDSSASETLAPSTVSALGVETEGTITVNVTATYEKVSLKIHNSDNTVPSNTITYYSTNNAFATLVVAAKDATSGTSQDVTATGVALITGKTNYIIADSATATFFATAGTLASTSAVNFKNGVATVSYATPLIGGNVQIKATPSETATVASAFKNISVASPMDATIASLVAAIAKLQKAINKIQKRLAR